MIMKVYTHKFPTQAEALKYFLRILCGACNRGYTSEQIEPAFEASIQSISDTASDLSYTLLLIANPIAAFYGEIAYCGLDSMHTDFSMNIEATKDSGILQGLATWNGTCTPGRSVSIEFKSDGTAVMEYTLGERDGVELESSRFLSMPCEGDTWQ